MGKFVILRHVIPSTVVQMRKMARKKDRAMAAWMSWAQGCAPPGRGQGLTPRRCLALGCEAGRP
jgi:hypothetical protein